MASSRSYSSSDHPPSDELASMSMGSSGRESSKSPTASSEGGSSKSPMASSGEDSSKSPMASSGEDSSKSPMASSGEDSSKSPMASSPLSQSNSPMVSLSLSTSNSPMGLSPSPSSSSDHTPPEKLACVCVNNDTTGSFEWFAFVLSDDNQHTHRTTPTPLFLGEGEDSDSDSDPDLDQEEEEEVAIYIEPIAITGGRVAVRGWGFVGSKHPSLYRIGMGMDGGCSVGRIDLGGGGGGGSSWESIASMPNSLASRHACIFLTGKLYCLGGYLDHDTNLEESRRRRRRTWREQVEVPWAMAYDLTRNIWESLPDPPCRVYQTFSAAIDHQRIVVGSPKDDLLQVYNVDTKVWEEHKFERRYYKRIISPTDLVEQGATVAVDNKLYWYSVYKQCLVGYDLETRMWFKGYVPMHDHLPYMEPNGYRCHDPPCLAHVGGGNNFCLFWVSLLPGREPDYPINSRIHCMKFQVVATGGVRKKRVIPLEVSILSCQSYIVHGIKSFVDGLVMDGHLGLKSSEISQPLCV